ncbi:hypothetical protein AAG570_011538 [Ranatra chinensis]|uniref:Uncharacterized protein n=1 Tax=Ranatra chinensis TaxID=642074 RepID=A0ABD0YL22_9HEMI
MASKRRNMFHKNKTQETTEEDAMMFFTALLVVVLLSAATGLDETKISPPSRTTETKSERDIIAPNPPKSLEFGLDQIDIPPASKSTETSGREETILFPQPAAIGRQLICQSSNKSHPPSHNRFILICMTPDWIS